jgi:hypothetical protein
MLLFSRIMQRFSNRMWLCISFAGWQLLACKDATPTSIRDITDASLVGEGGTGITPRLRTYFNRPEARQAIMPHTKCNIAQ